MIVGGIGCRSTMGVAFAVASDAEGGGAVVGVVVVSGVVEGAGASGETNEFWCRAHALSQSCCER